VLYADKSDKPEKFRFIFLICSFIRPSFQTLNLWSVVVCFHVGETVNYRRGSVANTIQLTEAIMQPAIACFLLAIVSVVAGKFRIVELHDPMLIY
jgi:hypothetical protein